MTSWNLRKKEIEKRNFRDGSLIGNSGRLGKVLKQNNKLL